jgi:putative endonuclease
MWYLYILRCRDKSLYTGITTNIERRLREHNAKKGSRAIRGRLPAKVVYREKHRSHSKALSREATIKSWTRSEKLVLIKKDSP